MNLLPLLPIVNLVGFIALVVATVFYNLKSGKGKIGDEVLGLYQKQIEALKEDVTRGQVANADIKSQMTAIVLRVGQLEGQLKEKDARITELTATIENRNPELEGILREIRDFMRLIHDQTTKNEKRNIKIDRNTDDKVGNLMRSKNI